MEGPDQAVSHIYIYVYIYIYMDGPQGIVSLKVSSLHPAWNARAADAEASRKREK